MDKNETILIKLDIRDPNLGQLREIVKASRQGKIVAFPTETVYGMGAPMNSSDIASRLSRLKNREPGKPFSYHIGSWTMVDALEVPRTPEFRFLTRQFWPGPMTLIVTNRKKEKIGLRFPHHRIATALINTAGSPFIATSANLSGSPSPHSAEDVMSQFNGKIGYVIDGGKTEYQDDSTVVDLTARPAVMLRRGAQAAEIAVAIERIRSGKFPRRRVVIVCTGNSCRSPMAKGWLETELRKRGLADEIEVDSRGIMARPGQTATPEAVLTMKNHEIDIADHRTRPLTREDVMDADLILCMAQDHYHFINAMVPLIPKQKIQILDIPDPIGMGVLMYEEVLAAIERKLRSRWDDIIA